jgi:hypothetical protein
MKFKGSLGEFGTTRKEKKDDTEIIHRLKVAQKGDFGLTVASWDKELMAKMKQDGLFSFDPSKTEITITVQCKVKKEKHDKEDENLLPNTGNPWFTFKQVVDNDDWESEVKMLLDELHEVEFA